MYSLKLKTRVENSLKQKRAYAFLQEEGGERKSDKVSRQHKANSMPFSTYIAMFHVHKKDGTCITSHIITDKSSDSRHTSERPSANEISQPQQLSILVKN